MLRGAHMTCLALTKGPGNSSISLVDLFCLKSKLREHERERDEVNDMHQ